MRPEPKPTGNAALDAANRARMRKADLLEGIHKGEISPAQAINDPGVPVRLDLLLRAFPNVGDFRAAKIMREAGVHAWSYVGGEGRTYRRTYLTPAARARLVAAVEAAL